MKKKPSTKLKLYYIQFFLRSSRGTNERLLRAYKKKPSHDQLEGECIEWCKGFAAWEVSENVCHYGWNEIKRLPRGRKDALAKHALACKRMNYWRERRRLFGGLLGVPPFNGQKILDIE